LHVDVEECVKNILTLLFVLQHLEESARMMAASMTADVKAAEKHLKDLDLHKDCIARHEADLLVEAMQVWHQPGVGWMLDYLGTHLGRTETR
jgi:hypothetical protein